MLAVGPEQASIVREIFDRFPTTAATEIARDLKERGVRTPQYKAKSGKVRGGWPIYLNRILSILRSPIYTGHIVHRGDWIEGTSEPIVTQEVWQHVQEITLERTPGRHDPVRNPLLGILHDENGRRMRNREAPVDRAAHAITSLNDAAGHEKARHVG